MAADQIDDILEGADPDRRAFLKRVAFTSAFAVPVITTFSMTGFGAGTASAFGSNTSGLGSNITQEPPTKLPPQHGSNITDD